MACKYEYKGKWYTQEELMALPEFRGGYASNQEQRNLVNNNTGPVSEEEINFFAAAAPIGMFNKYVLFKENQLREIKRRIGELERQKKAKTITSAQLIDLTRQERELKMLAEGKYELNIKGIRQDIAEIRTIPDIMAIGYYVEKDLERLEKLSKSTDLDDINEADNLIKFYQQAGTFVLGVDNPFFQQDEIFLDDGQGGLSTHYKISDTIRNQFIDRGNRAEVYSSVVNKRREEVMVTTVNQDPSVKNTYNKPLTIEGITSREEGLKDTDYISMWVMDVTNGIFSHNGVLPQVMYSHLVNRFEGRLKWAREIAERVDEITPEVQRVLMSKGYSLRGSGILGIRGASYNVFKEITKEGNETGGIIQRFSREFYDANSAANNTFSETFDYIRSNGNLSPTDKSNAYNQAFENLKLWKRQNTIIMDVNRVPEIAGDNATNQAYKTELVNLLGTKGYNEQLARQERMLQKYDADRQSMIDILIEIEGVADFNGLSPKAKADFDFWEHNHNPKLGVENFNSVSGLFYAGRKTNNFMDYNNFIPRKFKPQVTANKATNKYDIADTNVETDYHSEKFTEIENDPTLSKFYDIAKEVVDAVRENMPYELQSKVAANTLPMMMKTSAEIIADKNNGPLSSLFLAFRNLMERIRLSFGVVKQAEVTYAVMDPVTGKTNYKVNDQFMKTGARAVRERMTIEKAKFATARQSKININKFTTLPFSSMGTNELILLANYVNVDISVDDIQKGNTKAIHDIVGDYVKIGKYIRDYSLNQVVQSQSFDLAKMLKYFSNLTMAYAARREALPILEVMKQHYDQIKKPKTNNLGRGIYNANDEENMMDGVRTNAVQQMEDWFERVALDNYGTKHFGPHGQSAKRAKAIKKMQARIDEINMELATTNDANKELKLIAEKERLLMEMQIPGYGKTIYSEEDKKKLGEIENLLTQLDINDKEQAMTAAKLIRIKEGLGKARTATAFFDNLWAFIRTMRLGYNLSSSVTNFIEGTTSNMIIAASGEYFDSKEIYPAYTVMRFSFMKNLSFGTLEYGESGKNRRLMDKFNVIMDSKNELQKSSVKSHASRASWMAPHELNQRVEFINQSPIMIAMLRTLKIKDKNGNESSVWAAMGEDGHLKDDFKTSDNVENWEDMKGQDYQVFKQKLHKAIVLGHGNYHDLRGMMIKSSTAGKALMMFKTWVPMQFYWRFAVEQDDIQSGKKGYKGRYWSYGKGGLAVHAGIVGLATLGPWAAIATAVAGFAAGSFFGTDSGVGMLKETLEVTKAMFKKVVGMPVNLLVGRQIIGGDKDFQSWVANGKFSETDAKNMRANMADIGTQLMWIATILLVKGMLWDDDDEPDSAARIAHNIMVNRLMTLSSQSAMYINPVDTYENTIGSNAVVQYFTDIGKELTKVNEALSGRDIIQSGRNAGESGLWNQTKKSFLPGFFKDSMFGFETQAERVFEESPMHPWFKSATTKDRETNKRERASRRLELEEELNPENYEGETKKEQIKSRDKEIRKIVDEELPTPTKLKKMEMTREEYEESKKEDNE